MLKGLGARLNDTHRIFGFWQMQSQNKIYLPYLMSCLPKMIGLLCFQHFSPVQNTKKHLPGITVWKIKIVYCVIWILLIQKKYICIHYQICSQKLCEHVNDFLQIVVKKNLSQGAAFVVEKQKQIIWFTIAWYHRFQNPIFLIHLKLKYSEYTKVCKVNAKRLKSFIKGKSHQQKVRWSK